MLGAPPALTFWCERLAKLYFSSVHASIVFPLDTVRELTVNQSNQSRYIT